MTWSDNDVRKEEVLIKVSSRWVSGFQVDIGSSCYELYNTCYVRQLLSINRLLEVLPMLLSVYLSYKAWIIAIQYSVLFNVAFGLLTAPMHAVTRLVLRHPSRSLARYLTSSKLQWVSFPVNYSSNAVLVYRELFDLTPSYHPNLCIHSHQDKLKKYPWSYRI